MRAQLFIIKKRGGRKMVKNLFKKIVSSALAVSVLPVTGLAAFAAGDTVTAVNAKLTVDVSDRIGDITHGA